MIGRFICDQRGNMAILFGFGFLVSAMVAAVAVDAAALYHERRMLQAGVDLAAIEAARAPAQAETIARAALARAGLLDAEGTDLSVVSGRYVPDPALAPARRFAPGAEPANAVKVALHRPGRLYFAASFAEAPEIGVAGLASVSPQVSFSIGSRLASLNGGLANALLSRLLGTQIALSVLDYRALADARVNVLAFLDALAQDMHVTAGSYDSLLEMNADAGAIAAALASLTTGSARSALAPLSTGGADHGVPLGRLFDLGPLGGLELGEGAAADLAVSALDILTAAAALADGTRQVSLNLGAGVPGLAGLGLDLALGEPAQGSGWFAVGPEGTLVRTGQLRLRIVAQLLGGPVLLGAGVSLPLWLELAPSVARVESATCPSPENPRGTARLAVRPGIARLALGALAPGEFTHFGAELPLRPARLVDALLLRITGSGLVEMAQTGPVLLDFSSADIAAGRVRTARTQTPISSLAGSLLGDLDLDIAVLGLGLASPALIAQALGALIMPLAPTLDLTLDGVLSALGLGLGEADLRVYGVSCANPVLVG